MPGQKLMLPLAQSAMLAAKAHEISTIEITKGCRSEIDLECVEIEPPYRPVETFRDVLSGVPQPLYIPAVAPKRDVLRRLKIWAPSTDQCDWLRSELFVKQLQGLKHRMVFEILGNQAEITIGMMCHAADEPVLRAAFLGEFPEFEITEFDGHPADVLPECAWATVSFLDFFPPPPYSRLFTRSSELRLSPLAPFLNTLGSLHAGRIGLYQVVVQPVSPEHNWHRNIQCLIDLEYTMKAYGGGSQQYQRYAQQAPSAPLQNMANEIETKSHSDKPFLAAAVRVAEIDVSGEPGPSSLEALATFTGLFQHGGRPLLFLSQADYLACLSPHDIQKMFALGLTFRAGCILNSLECTSILHMPPLSSLTERRIACPILVSKPPGEGIFAGGTHIGYSSHAGERRKVYISEHLESSHVHVLGLPRMGKSCLMEHESCEDVEHGHGIAIIDPHGDLAENVLCRIKEKWLDRVIYFNPGDPDFVPLWNPFAGHPRPKADRIADDLLRAFIEITTGWGDRLETLLRQAFYGLIHTNQGTLADVAILFSWSDERRNKIRDRILASIQNANASQFWQYEYPKYRKEDFAPVQHKLQKFLLYNTMGLMFSQPETRFNFRDIMDSGKIFIANLSTVGSQARDVLGSFFLSLFHLAALSRSDIPPERRKLFKIYLDEAHRFVTPAIEDMIVEVRKYRVNLVLAHQYLSQFEKKRCADVLGVVGTIVAFNTSAEDAVRIAKRLGGQVTPEELTQLEQRQAIVRIGTDVVRIETPLLEPIMDTNIAEKAKRLSREHYYKPFDQVWNEVNRQGKAPAVYVVPRVPQVSDATKIKVYTFDEFVVQKRT